MSQRSVCRPQDTRRNINSTLNTFTRRSELLTLSPFCAFSSFQPLLRLSSSFWFVRWWFCFPLSLHSKLLQSLSLVLHFHLSPFRIIYTHPTFRFYYIFHLFFIFLFLPLFGRPLCGGLIVLRFALSPSPRQRDERRLGGFEAMGGDLLHGASQ